MSYGMMVLYIFVLAVVLGTILIGRVPPLLQTPLMSASNAISGITLVGAILAAKFASSNLLLVFVCLATALATTNIVGGYTVTNRMLAMFHRKDPKK